MIPREVQFAEKLHAYTMPRSVPNSRVRDLIDMVLLINEGKLQHEKAAAALKAVFARRKTHVPAEALEPPPHNWESVFAGMAKECGLEIDLKAGFEILSRFYSRLV
jgi:hypothetical protein